MKLLLVIIVMLTAIVLCNCNKEELQSQVKEARPVLVQMEVVNASGYSTFYDQQMVK